MLEQNAFMENSLLALIDEALGELRPMVDASFEPAVSTPVRHTLIPSMAFRVAAVARQLSDLA